MKINILLTSVPCRSFLLKMPNSDPNPPNLNSKQDIATAMVHIKGCTDIMIIFFVVKFKVGLIDAQSWSGQLILGNSFLFHCCGSCKIISRSESEPDK